MSFSISKALGLLLVTSQISGASTTVAIDLLSNFNAVTFSDYSPQGPNVEGRVLVGGTFNVSSALPFNSIGNAPRIRRESCRTKRSPVIRTAGRSAKAAIRLQAPKMPTY